MNPKTIKLTLKPQPFISNEYKEELTGFLLQYNNSIYGITVHHNLPIETLYNSETKNSLDIIINSCWSEALIFKTNNINTSQYNIFKKIQNRIPNADNDIFTIINNERAQVKFVEMNFEPFDGFNSSPKTPYILVQLFNEYEKIAGNSGAPVYMRDNGEDILIGVLSKYRPCDNMVYVIPIYLFIKNIEKKDNNNIYGIDINMNISKIGSFNVNNNINHGKCIYNPSLKINIPLSTYFLIEGDESSTFTINYSDTQNKKSSNNISSTNSKNTNSKNTNSTNSVNNVTSVNNVNTIIINSNLIVSHESSLLFQSNGNIKANLRFLSLLKRITNIEMQKRIFSKIEKNVITTKNNDFWLSIKPKS